MISTAQSAPEAYHDLVLSRGLTESAPLQVLILDDERFDRHRLARFCSGLDICVAVTNASTLEDFRTKLANQRFELILLDYMLPDGTGLDAMESVRLSAANVNAATIMITGQGQDDVAAEAISYGCADYLTKDELSPNAFRRAVTNALQKSDLTTQVEAQSFARSEVEAVLEHFASSFARDIKPMVSRMLRQLRDLRGTEQNQKFEALDTTCLDMWEALIELERNTGPEIMALAAIDKTPTVMRTRDGKARVPPSPFTKVPH